MKPIKFNNNNHLPKEALILYKPKQKNNDMKSAAERITRGKGNFINCTDYDDAVKAINETASEVRSEMLEFAEWCMDAEIYHSTNQKHWIYNADETSQLIFKTPDELFSYWLTNIKANENSR